jgi:hypothetical protein
MDTRDELLASISDAAASKKKPEDQLNEQHAVFTQELQSALRLTAGFFEHLLWTVTDFLFLFNKFVILTVIKF